MIHKIYKIRSLQIHRIKPHLTLMLLMQAMFDYFTSTNSPTYDLHPPKSKARHKILSFCYRFLFATLDIQ